MQTLSAQLKTVKGKKSYGYLPKSVKKTVDEVVDKLEELPEVRECYEQWCALQSEVDSYYHDKPQERIPLSQQKEFRQIKNAVIQVAEQVWQNEITFEDAGAEQDAEQNETYSIPYPTNAWYAMATDETLPLAERDEAAKQLEALADGGD